jgi:hypothetical protein
LSMKLRKLAMRLGIRLAFIASSSALSSSRVLTKPSPEDDAHLGLGTVHLLVVVIADALEVARVVGQLGVRLDRLDVVHLAGAAHPVLALAWLAQRVAVELRPP